MIKASGSITNSGIKINAKIGPVIPIWRNGKGVISVRCVACGEMEPVVVGVTMKKSPDGYIDQYCLGEQDVNS